MTIHEVSGQIDKLNKRIDLLVEAVNTLRRLAELNSQRIDNMQDALFNLFPKKETPPYGGNI